MQGLALDHACAKLQAVVASLQAPPVLSQAVVQALGAQTPVIVRCALWFSYQWCEQCFEVMASPTRDDILFYDIRYYKLADVIFVRAIILAGGSI